MPAAAPLCICSALARRCFRRAGSSSSITTQILVVFAIRTRRPLFLSRPHLFLVAMALGVIAVAIALPFLPVVGLWFGFVVPPPLFFVFLIGATLAYLAIVEITKRIFYRAMSAAKG